MDNSSLELLGWFYLCYVLMVSLAYSTVFSLNAVNFELVLFILHLNWPSMTSKKKDRYKKPVQIHCTVESPGVARHMDLCMSLFRVSELMYEGLQYV